MKRKAIGTYENLGALYDGYRDQVLGQLILKDKKLSTHANEIVRCEIIRGKTDQIQNLLGIAGIGDELQLSLLANLVPKAGIALLIDYPHPVNEFTRFLCYTYVDREERLHDEQKKAKKQIESRTPETDATHIITAVRWGIDFVAVVQLPSDTAMVGEIDATLERIWSSFDGNHKTLSLTKEENTTLRSISNTKVYSNMHSLTFMTAIHDIYLAMDRIKTNNIEHRPIDYTLRLTKAIFPKHNDKDIIFNPPYPKPNNEIERHFIQPFITIKYLKTSLHENALSLLRQHLKGRLSDVYMEWLIVREQCTERTEVFAKLLVNYRHGQVETSEITEAISGERQKTLAKDIDDLANTLHELKTKGEWIKELQQQSPFQYWNVAEQNVGNLDNEQTIEQTLLKDHQQQRILCSTDILRSNNPSKWNKLRDQLIEEHQTNRNLHLIYADFSYCSYQLPDIITLPLCKMTKTEDANKHDTSSPSTEPKPSVTPPTSSTNETFSILLLGESGVGKSTFINAFANYLTFETFQEAERGEPVVLMPVSFMMTTGDNFEERTVKFGDVDSLNNEDFSRPGQSVTQHCKSYVFHLNHRNGRKLRIIDTPGFGDTRGLDQDDLNMQYILEYINNFTHLNAVCFLLKPNVARLNIFFRTCLTELFNFLGPNIRNNIIFCFTNARSTFYTPGDTGPLLRTMLDSLPKMDIPFKKENTFCFDSESFRYLVALKGGIKFEDKDKQEYEMSWSKSVIESNRFTGSMQNSVAAYRIESERKSTKHAQVEIVHMVRPLLEAMRNTLRNIVLIKMNVKKTSVQLQPKAIDRPVTLCSSSKRQCIETGMFWILSDCPHQSVKASNDCLCTPNQHIPIDYVLEYKISNSPPGYYLTEMLDQLSLLLNASTECAHYLKCTSPSLKDDPFLTALKHLTLEEKQICVDKRPATPNKLLLAELEQLIDKYQRKMNGMKSNKNDIELPVIYERIKIACNYPEVHEQIIAVKKGQENIMKHYEYEVPQDLTNTSVSESSYF